jgi:ketosteroid isomerase-like protein
MMRRFLLIVVFLAFASNAVAGPKEDAQAVFDKFLNSFTAANAEEVVSLFTPDALFWGTTMANLATTPDAIRQYFVAAFGTPARAPGVVMAATQTAVAGYPAPVSGRMKPTCRTTALWLPQVASDRAGSYCRRGARRVT